MKDCVEIILNWYIKNKRDLPWRIDKNPYSIWISEIMLQQTRIEAVIEYYYRFMKRIPDIKTLSEIPEDELLKLWEGLGYYSRARNLKKAASFIMENYNGVFPNTYQEILSLPGVGEYTAGAIASICFNLHEVAIDGNVMRVFCRVENQDLDVSDLKVKKEIGNSLKKILPKESGDFNQGIMELGETICIPNGTPKCDICPLKEKCLSHFHHREDSIPRKVIKKEKEVENYTVFLLKYHDFYAIQKRNSGLLKNMWEFPNTIGNLSIDEVKSVIPNIISIKPSIANTHIFTHKKWIMSSYLIEVSKKDKDYQWVLIDNLYSQYAIPTAFKSFLKELKKEESK